MRPNDGNLDAINQELEAQERYEAQLEANEEHPCCWCNDEDSEDGTGEVHPWRILW
jgi:hypothetical protein